MRTRDEVLSEYMERPDCLSALADRIRELEAEKAASEPVAWAGIAGMELDNPAPLPNRHPSAVAVTITDAMVEAAARAFYGAFYDGDRLWSGCPEDIRVWWMDAGRDALTAALTAPTPEGA